MGAMVAATWSQPVVSHSPPLSQTTSLASAAVCSRSGGSDGHRRRVRAIVRLVPTRSPLLAGTMHLLRSGSCEVTKSRGQLIRRSSSSSSDAFPGDDEEEEFAQSLEELGLRFHLSEEEGGHADDPDDALSSSSLPGQLEGGSNSAKFSNSRPLESAAEAAPPPPPSLSPHRWPVAESDELVLLSSVERNANSVDLPVSLRMLKRKKQWEEGFRNAGESAYCSIKRAFSSMVFIIRELQTFTLQMREVLFYQDLQEILVRVQREMHASFVWLFEQVFSSTPTLMVCVMILLANFTVYSMSNTAAIAAPTLPTAHTTATASTTTAEENGNQPKFDSISTITSLGSGNRMASVGGGSQGGGGRKARPVAGAGGDGRFEDLLNLKHAIFVDEVLGVSSGAANGEDSNMGQTKEEEVKLWKSMMEEASRMQVLDRKTMRQFVSPISVQVDAEDSADYFRTELEYLHALSEEPNNALILSNYAQFLYLVIQDHDRAEEYFKRAVKVEPPDAEALRLYANFLWQARNDLVAAEETYLEAIAADPSNTFHAANYAHFLWNTGGEDTCYPLS